MKYWTIYNSLLGKILLEADELGITKVAFLEDNINNIEEKNDYLRIAINWLNIYFSGENPDFMPPIHMIGTNFQKRVWEILLSIPYGKALTYGDISKILAKEMGIKKMSAQAIGKALSKNQLLIIVPCHMVIGKNNELVGYNGGIWRKKSLLQLENPKIMIRE